MAWNAVLCLLLLASSFSSLSLRPCTGKSHEVAGKNGVVAADEVLCSDIGVDVLKKGGHAVDAAVAAALCLGVVSPASSGLGGGAFLLVRSANGSTKAYDMRETAPSCANKTMYKGNATLKAKGPLSIAVPGELAGLNLAWRNYGKLPWKSLVQPAIRLASRGFKISPYLHMQMNKTKSDIMADEGLKSIFTRNGSLLGPGETCRNVRLAETLKEISDNVESFYNGPLGQKLVDDVRKAKGILSQEDLRSYKVEVRNPVEVDVMGVKVLSMGPPSTGGPSLALMLNILEGYTNFSDIGLLSHREIEALKHAFAVRMNLGDPAFVNVKCVLRDMLSKVFAETLRKTINDSKTFDFSHYGGRWNQIHDHGTSHISIVDRERNAVSMTTSINAYFGSTFLSTRTGIVLNNEMDDFSMPQPKGTKNPGVFPPAPNNFVEAGKRPLSSMTPTIIVNKDGTLRAVVGGRGGSNIIGAVAEVLLNYLKRQMDPLSCVVAPRLFHQLIPNVVLYENWTVPTGGHFEVPKEIRTALTKRNHTLQSSSTATMCQFVVQEFINGSSELIAVRKVLSIEAAMSSAKNNLLAILHLSLSMLISCHQEARPGDRGVSVISYSGVVAMEEGVCSDIGRDILIRGGHAVDASVAAAFSLGVVDPPFSSLGGGGIMLVRQSTGESRVFDMLETAPVRAIKVLKILEQYGLPSGVSGLLGIHRTIEALKYALSSRTQLGDPDFVNITSTLFSMLSTRTAKRMRDNIDDATTYSSYHYGGKYMDVLDHGTTHVSVVDVRETQLDGKVKAVIGGAGGMFIAAAVTEVILNHFASGMDPIFSVMAPRFYPKLNPNVLYYKTIHGWVPSTELLGRR
ncbi:Gamma-glutamyltranspeptidase 1 [Striga hermonthica]|uniref:Glutathione hydrolase n=1 Tax=Striga hermonthica TaxID=68872 RepID=A0A9N7R1U6_STRHE|nr:Gamma-glutamyltranspeptidase 1 [Striga hermonthica]